ncbi:Protein-L-isoaspartate O-methyltransferase [Pirellulimonas nuda]|uniref:Protein-L-isoaspartate O-methyltransferase n=1 Tax=Pirellulimonas nuda TaxID=2528009 RepID=A0A518DAA7_9BACT|nr:protein-L-isoaspartate(D-aspartate) O-methyltransferase [Pirellulimonas nuda]QDU88356.1 Protein-L-isoaspartate O-methyltransferase [Pirellulimonas nuda]
MPPHLRSIFSLLILLAPIGLSAQSPAEFARQRDQMVDDEIVAAGVKSPRVVAAMRQTPRHEFMPLAYRKQAYLDMALPIGSSQTISPPFVVAYMTEQLDPQPDDKVLEIGSGSGYQAAVLSGLAREVYTIEIVGTLGRKAERTLRRLGYDNVHVRVGDGYLGWPAEAPFDKIIVTCSPEDVPAPLVEQLAEGGRMVIPVGERHRQDLVLLRKRDGRLEREPLLPTLFVPMTGEAEERREMMPDPRHPSLVNGGFEEQLKQSKLPSGWHYVRQAEVMRDPTEAPEGDRYLLFKNSEPGRGCWALQGLAVDGRHVRRLKVSFQARGTGIRPGQTLREWPYVAITFYDDRREEVGVDAVGPLRGDFAWGEFSKQVSVPVHAREAIIRIGLLGAVGELALDEVRVEAAGRGSP